MVTTRPSVRIQRVTGRSVPRNQISEEARRVHEQRIRRLRCTEVLGPIPSARQLSGPPTVLTPAANFQLNPVNQHAVRNLLLLKTIIHRKLSEQATATTPRAVGNQGPVWFSPQGLWNAFHFESHKVALLHNRQNPVFGPLAHKYHYNGKILPVRRTSSHIIGVSVATLFVYPRGKDFAGQTEAFLIRRAYLHVPLPRTVCGQKVNAWIPAELKPVDMKRGAIESFFKRPEAKKPKYEVGSDKSTHSSYPFAIPHLPATFAEQLGFAPAQEGKPMNDQLDLDLMYYQPYIPSSIAPGLFGFLRQELPFYRVQYNITRGGVQTLINTPRFTTVFGVDDTSCFTSDGSIIDAKTGKPVEKSRYKCTPRPIPQCLDELRKLTEGTTGETFNFCLVNYYADGKDSISYHSDDERFLGPNPAIASFSLGAKRDFLMKHKPTAPKEGVVAEEPRGIKLPLGSGDMVLMRGTTQANWLHSLPKRAGPEAEKGRINITFRKAMVKGGTENYYQYNVGMGGVHRWDAKAGKMVPSAVDAEANVGGT
ncbi:DNA repair family protein [Pyrenophora tritici-repentis]|nr:DNA repair family protein [Pyrenophora tritici-repentis]KAI2476960.1 DNA repair family protein [Pyrenophora tritici-repentis]